jgi:hypothetical protein
LRLGEGQQYDAGYGERDDRGDADEGTVLFQARILMQNLANLVWAVV